LVKVLQGRHRPPDDERLAERLWHLMEDHCAYRIVLELDELEAIDSAFVQQLGRLDGLARDHGGFLRLCGLSPRDWQLVVRHGLGDVFPPYRDRQEAVFASRGPRKPR
jgi:anti-anti-sigma regulatory factor